MHSMVKTMLKMSINSPERKQKCPKNRDKINSIQKNFHGYNISYATKSKKRALERF